MKQFLELIGVGIVFLFSIVIIGGTILLAILSFVAQLLIPIALCGGIIYLMIQVAEKL